MVVLLFLPKGGLVSTISNRSPGSAARESETMIGRSLSVPMPWSIRFMAQSRAVLCTSSQPLKVASFELALLVGGHVRIVLHHVVVRSQQKPAGPASRIADGLSRLRRDHVHHGLDQRTRSEVLAGAGLGVLRVLLQEAFVGVPFHVGAHRPTSFPCRSGRRQAAAAWTGPGTCSGTC